jgi:hypothetical protein
MKEFFASLMGPNAQGRTNAFGSNPDTLSLAGLLRLQGVPEKDAYIQAAGLNRQRQLQELQQQEAQTAQMQQMQLAQLGQQIAQNPNMSTNDIVATLMQSGAVAPANIAGIAGLLMPQEKVMEDKIFGEEPRVISSRGGAIQGVRPLGNPGGEGVFQKAEASMAETPKTAVGQFLQMSDAYAPNRKETLREREINKKDFNEFKKNRISPVLDSVRESDTNFNEIEKALKLFKTGTGADYRLGAKKLGNYLGLKNSEEVAAGELIEKASAKLVLDFAKQMKGVVSDKDIAFLSKMVPALSATPEGNRQIIEYYRKANERMKEYAKASEKYYSKNRTLEGFENAWADFTDKSPLFQDDMGVASQEQSRAMRPSLSRERILQEIERRKARGMAQ